MKAPNPNILIALVSCLAVVALVAKDVKRSGPGILSQVHGQVDELNGADSCSQCHGDSDTSPDQACLACHDEIGTHMGAGKGLHGSLGPQVQRACALCHSEHHGAAAALVNTRTFLIAGIKDVLAFDHELVGYELAGAHTDLECTQCHVNAKEPVLPVGSHRYLGLSQDCASCHEDPHGGQMSPSCVACHNQDRFDSFATFDHGVALKLQGSHGELTCFECHTPDTETSVEFLAASGAEYEDRSCADCHDSPHAESFLVGVRDQDPERLGCALCHVESDAAFVQEAPDLSVLLHAASGFSLTDPHGGLECGDCHKPVGASFASRFPGRPAAQCQSCHADPHGEQFGAGEPGASQCLDCHSNTAFAPHVFDADLHAASGFALEGKHADQECSACHGDPAGEQVRLFRGTPSSCNTCHQDVHDGQFDVKGGGDCSTCHSTSAFGDAHAQAFDHAKWTGFELKGAHEQNQCESCHRSADMPDAHGRSFGRISTLFGPVQDCQSCHADPHGGAFDNPKLPDSVGGKQGCNRCHNEASFRSAADGLDHGMWMGFELEGAHAEVSCSGCHAPLVRPDPHGRTWEKANGSSCSDCHANPHGDQFETAGVTDCSACHSPADTFQELLFDHDRDSRFALDDTHAELACVQCHRPSKSNANEPLQYKPLGTQCIDCHGETRRRLPGRRGK